MEKKESLRSYFQVIDLPLLAAVLVLFLIGVVSIYSAAGGAAGRGGYYAVRQLFWGICGIVAFVGFFLLDLEKLLQRSYILYGAMCFLLGLVLVLGFTAKGAKSWFSFGFMSFQPSELGKLVLALLMAHQLSLHPPVELKWFLLSLVLFGVMCVLVLLQPDLGSVLVYTFMILVSLIVSGAPWRYIGSLTGLGLALLPVSWLFLKEYQRNRILVFIQPSLDPLGAGYNVIQSRIAVGSGRLFGKGFMNGTQSKLRFLPEPHTDFIFSVFAEEFGLIGGIVVLFLFTIIFWRMIAIALKTRRNSLKILIASLTAWLWFQLFEAVAMSMGLMPVTGLPMPLMSYGGSSLLSTAIALALCLKVGVLTELERLETAVPGETSLYDM